MLMLQRNNPHYEVLAATNKRGLVIICNAIMLL